MAGTAPRTRCAIPAVGGVLAQLGDECAARCVTADGRERSGAPDHVPSARPADLNGHRWHRVSSYADGGLGVIDRADQRASFTRSKTAAGIDSAASRCAASRGRCGITVSIAATGRAGSYYLKAARPPSSRLAHAGLGVWDAGSALGPGIHSQAAPVGGLVGVPGGGDGRGSCAARRCHSWTSPPMRIEKSSQTRSHTQRCGALNRILQAVTAERGRRSMNARRGSPRGRTE